MACVLCERKDGEIKTIENVNYFIPTRLELEILKVGDSISNCFGKQSVIVEIYAKKEDINGKLFVCTKLQYGDNGTITESLKEDVLQRTLPITNLHSSVELDKIEKCILVNRN